MHMEKQSFLAAEKKEALEAEPVQYDLVNKAGWRWLMAMIETQAQQVKGRIDEKRI